MIHIIEIMKLLQIFKTLSNDLWLVKPIRDQTTNAALETVVFLFFNKTKDKPRNITSSMVILKCNFNYPIGPVIYLHRPTNDGSLAFEHHVAL